MTLSQMQSFEAATALQVGQTLTHAMARQPADPHCTAEPFRIFSSWKMQFYNKQHYQHPPASQGQAPTLYALEAKKCSLSLTHRIPGNPATCNVCCLVARCAECIVVGHCIWRVGTRILTHHCSFLALNVDCTSHAKMNAKHGVMRKVQEQVFAICV